MRGACWLQGTVGTQGTTRSARGRRGRLGPEGRCPGTRQFHQHIRGNERFPGEPGTGCLAQKRGGLGWGCESIPPRRAGPSAKDGPVRGAGSRGPRHKVWFLPRGFPSLTILGVGAMPPAGRTGAPCATAALLCLLGVPAVPDGRREPASGTCPPEGWACPVLTGTRSRRGPRHQQQ